MSLSSYACKISITNNWIVLLQFFTFSATVHYFAEIDCPIIGVFILKGHDDLTLSWSN